jgi:hypothetical protein
MAFRLPLQNYFTPSAQKEDWIRPNDWPVITAVNNEVKFLMSDINNASCSIVTSFTRTSGTQNITIDWGDGTTDVISTATSVTTGHQYAIGTGTPCSRGYTTFVIRVYFTGTGVSVLNNCRITSVLVSGNTVTPYDSIGLLEVYYGDSTQTVSMDGYYSNNLTNGLCSAPFLEYVRLPTSVGFSSMQNTFENCTALNKIDMPITANSLNNISSLFKDCFLLSTVTLPQTTALTTLSNVFTNCFQLYSVTFPLNLNSVTTISNLFFKCFNLKTITFPNLQAVTSITTIADTCTSLEWVKFEGLPTFGTGTTVTMATLFSSCTNLQTVYFPATCSTNARYSMVGAFSNSDIRHITFPNGFSPTTLESCFSFCLKLTSVVFQSSAPQLTTLFQTFYFCPSLRNVVLPSSVRATGVNLDQTFFRCNALTTITIPNNYVVTSMASTFEQCRSLRTINWSPGNQNSLTSLSRTFFECYSLESAPVFTSLNIVTLLSQTFGLCVSLKSVTLPSVLNSVTDIGSLFSYCVSLTSVSLPTSMSALTGLINTFQYCTSLRTVVLPNAISSSSSINYFGTFDACYSLRTVTLPGSIQYTNISSVENMFRFCGNLFTINNLDKFGALTGVSPLQIRGWEYMNIPSLSFSTRLAELRVQNSALTKLNKISSIRLLNTTTGQWGGFSPHINVSYTNLNTAALVQLFNDMAAQGTVTSKTINITSASGASGLTAGDRTIITSIGWTIIG